MTPSQEEVILKFMERSIENINTCLAGQYTLFKLLIEKGVTTEAELVSRLKDDKNLPTRKLGSNVLQEMLTPEWEKQIDFSKTEQELLNRACSKIGALILPVSWENEGVMPPNSTAQRNAYLTCQAIFKKRKIVPLVVACTKEDGVYLRYEEGGKSLIVEAYNSGDVGALVNDDTAKKILVSEDIVDCNFDHCLRVFD